MARLVSRVALVVTISYAALIAVLLIATWHFAEPEAPKLAAGRAIEVSANYGRPPRDYKEASKE